MGFVDELLGFGNSGGSWQAQEVPILQPTTLNQTNRAYTQTQRGLDQQQAFINALTRQNGLGNQASVFNQQQGLANQLQGIANGTGPNPALAQLANTTGQNIAAQSAMMAGQRGVSSNPGLIARQIAMQGAGVQQNAVGQAAAMQAQQQLSALGALQNQQAMMGNMANTQVANQAGGFNAYNQAAQSQQQNLLNAINQYNANRVAMQSNMNNANAGLQGVNAQGQHNLLSNVMGGMASGIGLAHGGEVPHYANGGMAPNLGDFTLPAAGPQSSAGKYLFSSAPEPQSIPQPTTVQNSSQNQVNWQGANQFGQMMGQAGAKLFSSSAPVVAASHGAMIPGQASVPGDSLQNDKVPAMLSPKEIVLPRSVTLSKNAPEKAKKFVEAVLARNGMRKRS